MAVLRDSAIEEASLSLTFETMRAPERSAGPQA